MPRYEQYGRLDSQPLQDGDGGFQGVNMLDAPDQLEPGEVASALNCRFTQNEAAQRGGYVKLPWTNRVAASSTTPLPFGTIYGAGVFRDPNGLEWAVIAADGKVFRTRENAGAAEIPLPPGVTVTVAVTFTQTFSGLVLFRGTALEPLIMVDLDLGFAPVSFVNNLVTGITSENPTDGTRVISPAVNGDWIGNRLFIPVGDYLEISDYLNPTRYASVRAQARINQGTSDQLVRFFPFNDNTGIAAKSGSIYVLNGIKADLADMSLTELTREYGCCAPQSFINTGADVWFLAERRGICSVRLTEQNEIQGVDLPASAPIQPLIDRIDWTHASQCVAVWHDNKAYFAVPLDDSVGLSANLLPAGQVYNGFGVASVTLVPGQRYRWTAGANDSTESDDFVSLGQFNFEGTPGAAVTGTVQEIYTATNNAVLVYDFLKQKWAGYDTGAGLVVKAWLKLTYNGARRLFFISADGFINLFEEGPHDEVATYAMTSVLSPGSPMYVLGSLTVATVPGARHYYQLGSFDLNLRNGSETLTGNGFFVAQGSSLVLTQNMAAVNPGNIQTAYVTRQDWTISPAWIESRLRTRAYTTPQAGMLKRWLSGELALRTWLPQFSVSLYTEGVEEEAAIVEDATRDNRQYYRPAFAANWDRTNVNDDHATPFRQDYGIQLQENSAASGTIEASRRYYVEDLDNPLTAQIRYNGVTYDHGQTFVGVAGVTTYTVLVGTPTIWCDDSFILLGDGINFDRLQETTEELNFRNHGSRGRCAQLELHVTAGRVVLASANVEARPHGQPTGTLA